MTTRSAMRLWPSKLATPAAVSSTNAARATSIITTSTTARWIFMVSRSLPAMEQAPVLRLGTVTSTQDVARDLAVGSIVVADYQTGGRGRLERRWVSPAGTALLVSYVLEPKPLLSLAAGVAAAEACGPDVRLKWPNDLLLDGRKVGGILVETTPQKAICGVGVNLTWAPEGAAQLGRPREEMFERLSEEIAVWVAAPADQVLARWRQLSATLGRRVRGEVPGQGIEGVAQDPGQSRGPVVGGGAYRGGNGTHL